MNILISGWYGKKNIGDELILDVFLEHCVAHTVTVLTQGVVDASRAHSVYHCDVLRFDIGGLKQWLSAKPFKVLRSLINTDCFVLGGGGILRESGNFQNLDRLLDEIIIARLMRKKIFVYGVSIGPIASDRGRKKIVAALKKCDFITVRDQKSMLFLEQSGIPRNRRLLAPDPVYTIGKRPPEASIEGTEAYFEVIKNNKIPIFLALGFVDDGNDLANLDSLGECLDKISKDFNVSFVSIPFRKLEEGSIDDTYVARELKKRTVRPSTLHCIEEEYDSSQIECIVDRANFILCVRLHSLIVALARATPFIAINYDPKVMDTAILSGVKDLVIEPDESMGKNLHRIFSTNYKERSGLKKRLKKESVRLANESDLIFKALDDLLAQ